MAVNPDPRTLFLPDPDAIPSVLGNKIAAILGGVIGVSGIAFHRYISRRPVMSGIQLHILFGVGGASIAQFFQMRRDRYNMDRDAVYRHYIELHPEDFPPPERVKVGDVFTTWSPVR
uniref:NADH dehydrogenase [ubiquinone] 1 subunit C2 n=1 Tax=Lygus hesperus TaxID=30085 RepID=A0A0A9WHA6_LYGHE